jgi:signal transduction histidine kinase
MNKLWVRLSLGFSGMVLAAVFVVALTGIWVGRNNPPRLDRLAVSQRLTERLADFYRARRDWTGSEFLLMGAQSAFDREAERDAALFLADTQRRILYHPQARRVGQRLEQRDQINLIPIQVDQRTVGYLGLDPLPRRPEGPSLFVVFLGRTLLTVATVVGISSILFGVVMSRWLTAPLNDLAKAAKAIGAHNLSQRVEEKGSDEMVAVARSFNEMAAGLEQAEQLRRNLLADVAHELRTPLSVLQGNLRAILDEVYPLEQAEIARLYEQTRFLHRLVNDLHELAQAEAKQLSLNLQETDLRQLVKSVVDSFHLAANEKEVGLEASLADDLPLVEVDPARITQVLQNLLANALRHTPPDGKIIVRLEAKPKAVQLIVADTGEGISPEHLPHIFNRFYRTDPARSRDRGGVGLGLAIVRALVETHGGKIKASSAGIAGQGSSFIIELPTGKNH